MDDKKFQNAIDSLLEQQALLYTDLQEMKEVQKGSEKRLGVLERACVNLYNATVEQSKRQEENAAQIAENGKQINELREAQKETNERLNAVIFMAEKYFSGENGKSKKK